MKTLKIIVDGSLANYRILNPVTAKGIGQHEVEFSFSEDWDGFSKFLTCEGNGESTYEEIIDNTCVIDDDCISEDGTIELGVFGIKDSDKRWTTTTKVLNIEKALVGTEESTDQASLEWWEQYYEKIVALVEDLSDGSSSDSSSSDSSSSSADISMHNSSETAHPYILEKIEDIEETLETLPVTITEEDYDELYEAGTLSQGIYFIGGDSID